MLSTRTFQWVAVLAVVALVGCADDDDPKDAGPDSGQGDGSSGSGGSAGTGGGAATGGGGGTSGTGATGGTGGEDDGGGGDAATDGGGGVAATDGGISGTGGNSGTGGTGAVSGTGGAAACVPIGCQNQVYKCGNCIDDDQDGLVDLNDPDCLGPCHNAEDTFYGSIPGQAGADCKTDCYFDSDSGSGNDDCFWDHGCDMLEPEGCTYNPNTNTSGSPLTCSQLNATQSNTCERICGPLTPNGCDCFGCCELPAGGGSYVFLGSEDSSGNPTCSLDTMDDPTKCQPCTPVDACLNTCARCELCLGKTELPADCFPPTGGDGGSGGTGGMSGTGGTGGMSGTGGTGGMSGTGGTGGTSGTGGTGGTSGTGGTGGAGCPTPLCAPGVQPCGVSCLPGCGTGTFCITGCCLEFG